MGRIIIITGKGGVGKTSVAAAHALRSAMEGKRTLLVSTDMAHNLGDIFETQVGNKLTYVEDKLALLELDPDQILAKDYPKARSAFGTLLSGVGLPKSELGENDTLPGLENLFSLLKSRDYYNGGEFDRIIVDCAPTGETLSILQLPELLAWYMEKFFPVGKVMTRVLSPAAKHFYQVQMPSRESMNEIEHFHKEALQLEGLLKNPEVTSVRIVCIPEKMVVEETKRSYMYLHLYRYQVDGVFINRILPAETGSPFMDHWHQIQQQYLTELDHLFPHVPVTKIPWFQEEIRGEKAVKSLVDGYLNQDDLLDVRVTEDNEEYTRIEGGYRLMLRVPGATEDKVKVTVRAREIDIRLGGYLRNIPLPNVLCGAKINQTFLKDGVLNIDFEGKEDSLE